MYFTLCWYLIQLGCLSCKKTCIDHKIKSKFCCVLCLWHMYTCLHTTWKTPPSLPPPHSLFPSPLSFPSPFTPPPPPKKKISSPYPLPPLSLFSRSMCSDFVKCSSRWCTKMTNATDAVHAGLNLEIQVHRCLAYVLKVSWVVFANLLATHFQTYFLIVVVVKK